MIHRSIKSFTLIGVCLAFGQAYATNLPVGGPLNLTSGSGFAGAPVASVSDAETWYAGATLRGNATFVEGVWVDPTTHYLDFFYQIQNHSTTPVILSDTVGNLAGAPNPGQLTLTLTGFGPGFSETIFDITSTTYHPGTLGGSLFTMPISGNAVVAANNSTPNDLIATFNYGLMPGQSSAILLVQTNATSSKAGGQAMFNWRQNPSRHGATGGTAFSSELITANTLEPAPEPSAYGALALGLAGLFFVVRRRAQKTAA